MNNRPIRIGTLVKLCGQPKLRASLCGEFPASRIVTVHHAEMGGSLWGEVGAHPVNVFVYLIFPKDLPRANETVVLGMNRYALKP